MGQFLSDIWVLLLAAARSPSVQTRALAIVAIAVGGLALISVVFSIYVVWLRGRNVLRARRWANREARWGDLMLEAVGGERTVEEVSGRVGRSERLFFLDFLLRYARRLTGREKDRVKELAVPFLSELAPLLRDRDPYRRARAVQTLGTLGLPDSSDTLVRAVDDDSPVVSMLAARALATHGGATYTEPILSNLDRFEQWGSEYVVSLLVSLGSGAEARLRGVMEDPSRSPRTRALVTDALGRLHDLESVGVAEGILSREAEPDLAASLLRLLSVLGGPEHQDRVREFLDHSHFAVRAEAYSALGALGTGEDTETLEAGLSDPSPWVALHAARGMRESGRRPRLLTLSESGSPGAAAAAQVLAEE